MVLVLTALMACYVPARRAADGRSEGRSSLRLDAMNLAWDGTGEALRGGEDQRRKQSMTLTARNIARHIIILIVILVTLTALAIWLELGPVVHSSA